MYFTHNQALATPCSACFFSHRLRFFNSQPAWRATYNDETSILDVERDRRLMRFFFSRTNHAGVKGGLHEATREIAAKKNGGTQWTDLLRVMPPLLARHGIDSKLVAYYPYGFHGEIDLESCTRRLQWLTHLNLNGSTLPILYAACAVCGLY